VKVKELIKQLQGLDGNMPVLFAFNDCDGAVHCEEPLRVGISAYVRHRWGEIDQIPPSIAKGDEPLAVILWP
jgi:hypothetical protein